MGAAHRGRGAAAAVAVVGVAVGVAAVGQLNKGEGCIRVSGRGTGMGMVRSTR